jgi:hypothetical protein
MRYKFEFVHNTNNSYFFETTLGIVYELKFKPSPYLLGDENAQLQMIFTNLLLN